MSAYNYPKIRVTPPGARARTVVDRDDRLLSQSMTRYYPLVVESGKDCIVRDVDGNEFIDFNSGLLCLPLGLGHPKLLEAMRLQSEKFTEYSWSHFYYEIILDLAEEIFKITPGAFEKKIFYCSSGAEAIESALKLCRWHSRRPLTMTYTGAFHGGTMGALSLTACKPIQRGHFSPLLSGTIHVPFPYCYRCPLKLEYPECGYACVDFIEDQVLKKSAPPDDVAALFLEPILGEGGFVVPPPDYFQRVRKITEKHDILLVADEVQSGMGRTGKWFAIEHWDTNPDIICNANSVASGLPLGYMISRAEIMDWEVGTHGNTVGGNPVACAVALEVIRALRQDRLLENATKQGSYIMKRFKELQEKHDIIGDVRGKGLMIGVEIVTDREKKTPGIEEAKNIVKKSFQRGVTIMPGGDSTLRIAPPLTIQKEAIDAGFEIIEGAVKEVSTTVGK